MLRENSNIWIDWLVAILVIACVMVSYIAKEPYEKFIPYASLGTFVIVGLLFLNHINWKNAVIERDWELGLVIIGIIVAVVNISISKSGWGALVTILNLLLILYLANKVKLDRNILLTIALAALLILGTWVGQGDKGFNTNLGSMIVFCMASYGLTGIIMFFQRKGYEKWGKIIVLAIMLIIVTPIVWFLRARCVLIGITVFLVLNYLIPSAVWGMKKICGFCTGMLLGISILLPMAYVWLWESGKEISFIFWGKNFFSGRNIVWQQFLTAFYKEPFTGIGSDFEAKIPDIAYMEVHNGLLNILVVYGFILFAIVIVLIYRRLTEVIAKGSKATVSRQAASFIIALLAVSIFENYVILASYNQLLLLLFIIAYEPSEQNQS